jgi:V/A-type H+-transporting ATPase subunit D
MNLLRARRQLAFVGRGAALVRQKRQALVRELFLRARPARDARTAIAQQAVRAGLPLWRALAMHGHDGLRALAWPVRPVEVELRPVEVSGLAAMQIASRPSLRRTADARGVAPGRAGPAAIEAAAELETLTDLLLDAAAKEQLLRRLGDAVSRTTRQLRVLEHRIAPTLAAQIAAVGSTLEEREREEHVRLERVRERLQRTPAD